jgi:hypothetical protein
LLEQVGARLGRHQGGSERAESAQAKAERLTGEELLRRGWKPEDLARRRKGYKHKRKIALRLRRETTMTWLRYLSCLSLSLPWAFSFLN